MDKETPAQPITKNEPNKTEYKPIRGNVRELDPSNPDDRELLEILGVE
jgi:hypothetical protein